MAERSVVIHTLNHNVTTPPLPPAHTKVKHHYFHVSQVGMKAESTGSAVPARCALLTQRKQIVSGVGDNDLGAPCCPAEKHLLRVVAALMALWVARSNGPLAALLLPPSLRQPAGPFTNIAKRRASWDTLTEAAAAVPTPPQAAFAVARKTLRNARESSPSPISPKDCKNSNRLLMDGCLHKAWAKEGLTLLKIHGVLTIRSNLWITSVWL